MIPSKDDEGKYSDEFRVSLLKSLFDIRNGRIYSIEEVKRELNL